MVFIYVICLIVLIGDDLEVVVKKVLKVIGKLVIVFNLLGFCGVF